FIGKKVTSVVSTGGANINTNGHTVTINSFLTHDSTLSGADGGLTKLGSGTLILTGNDSYTGLTTLKTGVLQLTGNAGVPILSGGGENIQGGETVFSYTSSSPISTIKSLLTTAAASNFASGQIYSSTVAADSTHLTSLGYGEASDLGLTLNGSALT